MILNMGIFIKVILFCSIVSISIGDPHVRGDPSTYVTCGMLPITINKNEVYDFDEVMQSELKSFPKRRKPLAMDFTFDSEDLKTISDDHTPIPQVTEASRVLEKEELPPVMYTHNPYGPPSPPIPVRQGVLARYTADNPKQSLSLSENSEIRIPSPPPAKESQEYGVPLPPHYKHNLIDNPERRRFTTPAPPAMLPQHGKTTKAPPREQRRDMIASVRQFKGEVQRGEEGKNYGERRRNSFNPLKKYVPRRPSQFKNDLERNEVEDEAPGQTDDDTESKSGLPSYIEHVLNKRNPNRGAQSANNPSSSLSQPISNPGDNSEGNISNNNQLEDLLSALGPDKLNQLRQLLASPSDNGPNEKEGLPIGKANLITARSKRRGVNTFRNKRSVNPNFTKQYKFSKVPNKKHNALLRYRERPHNETCNLQFKRGFNCKRLVFRLENWIDQVRDCEKEFLQISDGVNVKRICGDQDLKATVYLDVARVSITHYKMDVLLKNTMSFSGIIRCE